MWIVLFQKQKNSPRLLCLGEKPVCWYFLLRTADINTSYKISLSTVSIFCLTVNCFCYYYGICVNGLYIHSFRVNNSIQLFRFFITDTLSSLFQLLPRGFFAMNHSLYTIPTPLCRLWHLFACIRKIQSCRQLRFFMTRAVSILLPVKRIVFFAQLIRLGRYYRIFRKSGCCCNFAG